jgi:hypothetical protein
MISESFLETIHAIQQRATRVEHEAAELRQQVARMAELLASPASVVARYVIEGEIYEITQSDVDAVKAEMVKPAAEEALYELAVVKKMAKTLRERPLELQNEHFFKTVEAIRAAAVADGTAIESESEAAIDD